ncbi:MAG: hypothetical protein PHT41_02545 [Candidatus Omnitrophica bacterium]|nr:hypothetical protein [Candidatus Omnitrophota bacterium]MDD5238011.1 hypothetical protein [Candidatus Omnitrophota bacterium]
MARLSLKKKSKCNSGQSILEYIFVVVAILVVVLNIGVIGKMRTSFEGYFSQASNRLAGSFNVMHFIH